MCFASRRCGCFISETLRWEIRQGWDTLVYPQSMMVLTDELDSIFNNRDIEGNESDHGEYTDLDHDYSTDETKSSSEDEENGESPPTTSQEDTELRDKVGFLDIIGFKLVDFLDALSWGNIACVQDTKVRSEFTSSCQSCGSPPKRA